MAQPRPQPAASTSRARPAPRATSRPPLESLVYALIPSLAPSSSHRPDRDPRSSASGKCSNAGSRPPSRANGDVEESTRRERVRELMEWCEEIMGSRLPSTTPLAPETLPETARRLLSGDRALKFGGTWTKLERGRTLASPLPHLQFLVALSKLNQANAASASMKPVASSSRSMPPPLLPFPTSTFSASQSRSPNPSSAKNILAVTDAPKFPAPTDWKGKGQSKADILKAWRAAHYQPSFPTRLLLRDTLYLLQGIDGRYVRFAVRPPKEQNPYLTEKGRAGDGTGFALGKDGVSATEGEVDEGEIVGIDIVAEESKDGYILQPTRTLLVELSEMGMMYRKITDFVKSHEAGSSSGGMTEQSLCHFLHQELSDYHRLLAVLESQMTLTVTSDGQAANNQEYTPAEGSGLTLLRLGLWTADMRLKLRMMTQVVDDAKVAHGGALVSRIHFLTRHGDPFVRNFMDQILEEVSKPFFITLQRWIFSGDLHDPFQEFFVQLNPDISLHEGRISPYQTADAGFEGGIDAVGAHDEAHKLWEKKYVFVNGMVPGFVSEEFGKKIFSTGRSLNFIRYSCHDSDWIETQAKLANAGRALKYSDLAGLERSIDDAYAIASQRLLDIFFDKFVLLDHLRALKSYLMLGAGDFTELLMEAMVPRLSKPAISLYRHQLTSDLETAIRGSNAQYDSPDVLRRLDARVLEYSHGEIGWECFALEYKVGAPLNAVLDGRAMVNYDRLFHHLWRLKRVETALTQGWMRITSGSKLFERLPALSNEWHHCRVVQAEMVHFLRQIQAFCQLEVIECSWQTFMDYAAKREGDLDALIQAHRTYLDRVVRKILLLSSKRDKEVSSLLARSLHQADGDVQEILLDLVRDALDFILQFGDATDDLYAWSLAEATRLDRQKDEQRGLYTSSTALEDDPTRALEQLRGIRERVRTCSNNFQDRVVSVCHLAGSHVDLDIRFLAIRIAFNGHYALRKSKGGSKATRTA